MAMSFQKSKSQMLGQDVDTSEIISQSNMVIERCAKFKNRDASCKPFKPSCRALEDGKASEPSEVFELIIHFFTMILRLVLKYSEAKSQQLIEINKVWITTLASKLFNDDGEAKGSTRFLLPFPLAMLCVGYGMSVLVLVVMKILLFKITFFKMTKKAKSCE